MSIQPIRDEFVIADDITLHYVQWGTQGTPIICTHGMTANAMCFQALADELAPDHRIIAYDIRGRGDSDKLEDGYSIPIYAADLAALIDELELERPIVLGHSLGAMVSLYFAAHYPTKLSKLVLIDAGAPLPWNSFDAQPAWLKASLSRLGVPVPSFKEYINRLKAAPFLGPYWNDYFDLYFKHDVIFENDGSVVSKIYREALLEEAEPANAVRLDEQWAHVTVPTLLLRAGQGLLSDNDQLLSENDAQRIRQNIPNCQYANFPTLNHYTIIFGTEPGPGQAIHSFVDER
ncbi:MAG TPA: alpha/beta hydrolase [Ktedonobacteraceae bacterium]|jgi:pimeloyl-ACP methyl ester carboxylesterase